jgi:glycosyltransferase involved in cell wall biosynthesis
MRIAIVTGIYPPDIGGPATHAADLVEELGRRGHRVTLISLTNAPQTEHFPGVVRYPRRWPWPVRSAAVAWWLLGNRGSYDVVYATGMHPESVLGARLAGRPVVVKVVGDPAWERGRRLRLTNAGFDRFQHDKKRALRLRMMCLLRDWSVRRATAVTAPSKYLAGVVEGWLGHPVGVQVIPNGVRAPVVGKKHRDGAGGALRAVFVGRLVAHKHVDVLIDAVCSTPGVVLDVVGDGPERAALENRVRGANAGDRVRFTGDLGHSEALQHMAGADVLLMASTYEGLPHVAVEALACGTPVVAPGVGGIPEVIRDGANGLIVKDPSSAHFARSLSLLRDDAELMQNLSEQARRDGESWRFDKTVGGLEKTLLKVTGRKHKAVFIGKGASARFAGGDFERKASILVRHLEPTIVSVGRPIGREFPGLRLVAFPDLRPPLLGGAVFYSLGPVFAVSIAARGRGRAIVCQSPYEGFCTILLTRLVPKMIRPRVVVEVHGDWRTAGRAYGSSFRRFLSPSADRVAEWTVRRADRVRVVSNSLDHLVRGTGYAGEIDRFIAFSDLEAFESNQVALRSAKPLAAFVGSLEKTKGVDVLIDAWSVVVKRFPDASLAIAGSGSTLSELCRRSRNLGLDSNVAFLGDLTHSEVSALLDRSWLLVLPSRSEGLGRVILESFARGRPVVATCVGGIPELVEDGRTGLLVPPEDARALAGAIERLIAHADETEIMGKEGRKRFAERNPSEEFESGIGRLAAWISSDV